MKRLMLTGFLALAACSKPAPQAQTQSAAPPAPAPAYDPWPGRYEGDLMVRISPIHKVTLVTANAACTGDAGLAGGAPSQQVAPDHLRVVLTANAETCTVDILQKGSRLTVNESGDCSAWHGPSCSFNGAADRLK